MLDPKQDAGSRQAGAPAQGPLPPVAGLGAVPRRRRAAPRDPTLAELAWTLAERRWTVGAVLVAALLGAAAFLAVAPPVYEATALVKVDGRFRPAAPEDVVQLFDTNPPPEGEMRLLGSRALVRDVVVALGLAVEIRPRRFPVIGDALARRRAGAAAPVAAPLGLGRFAWGGERLRLAGLEVPPSLVGVPLLLVAGDGGAFELRAGGEILVAGTAGTPATGARDGEGASVLVSELVARPGTEFVVTKLRTDELVEGLRRSLEVTEQGHAGGLAEVRLAGADPVRTASIVEALATAYVRESHERASAEAASTLRTLEDRLPALRAEVDAAELALTRFYQRNGKVNLSVDGARLLARVNELEHAITQAELAEAEQQRRHTGSYPELAAPADAARALREQRAGVEAQIAALPGLELELARLTRQVAFARERHVRVLNRAEELRTAKASWIGNARVMEHAVVPHRPVKPVPALVMVVALLLGLGGGVAAAFVRSAFDGGVRDPAELEARARVPVLATVPRSETQRRIARARRGARLEPLALVDPADAAVEELRALRTGVAVALARAENHVVTIASAGPGAGKSFVTVNLAHLLAAPDGRVLVVDADLRRGVLHRYFGLEAGPGLSDVLAGTTPLAAALRPTTNPKLDVLTSGARVTNPAELLAGDALGKLLAEVGGRYSVVLVDTPPILSVTDGALVGRHAAVNLLVVRSGAQTPREISLAVKRLVRTGIVIRGAVLNDVQPTLGRYGRSGRYRRYDTRPA